MVSDLQVAMALMLTGVIFVIPALIIAVSWATAPGRWLGWNWDAFLTAVLFAASVLTILLAIVFGS